MRHLHLYIYFPLLALLATLSACVGEELSRPKGEGTGYLRLTLGDISATVSGEVETKAGNVKTVLTKPEESDLYVKITNTLSGEEVYKETLFSTFPAEGKELPTASYLVEVYTKGEFGTFATDFDAVKGYFVGSKIVSLLPNDEKKVTIDVKWGYSSFYPTLEEDLSVHFVSYKLLVTQDEVSRDITPAVDGLLPFYLLAGKNTTISLEGTNQINEEKTIPLKSWDELPAATEYNLILKSDIPVFELRAEAVHTTNEHEELNGTEIRLTVGDLSGIPTALIKEWKAELVNASGTVVRSFTSNTVEDGVMMDEENPYIPQGTYTLNYTYAYTIGDQEIKENNTQPITVSVPQPNVQLTFAPYTSYTKYKEGDIQGANACTNNIIYDLKASVNVAEELMSKYNGTLSFTYDGKEQTGAVNTYGDGDTSVSEWRMYNASASVSFDGVEIKRDAELHVTGMPYSFNFYDNESALNASDWTQKNVNYEMKKCTIQKDGSNGYLISPKFYMPESIALNYSIQAQYYCAVINPDGKSIDLQVGVTPANTSVATSFNTHTCSGNNNTGVSYGTCTGVLSLSSETSYMSFYHSNSNISLRIDYLCLYEFTLQY
ncbi:hypothetical protein [Parabacteroides sp.]